MNSPLYVRTTIGLAKLKALATDVSVERIRILKMLDGKKKLDELISSLGGAEQMAVLNTLKEFERLGIIHAIADDDEFDAVLAAMEIKAFSDGKNCEQALLHRGFYMNTARVAKRTKLAIKNMLHVLVVDDDEAIVKLLTLLLEENGYRVTALMSGADVLSEMRKPDAPDFLLLDVVLPSKSGFEILASIRLSSDLKDVPVVLLTGEVANESVIRGLHAGADGYVCKPFKWSPLYACINAVITGNP
jgi:CheY-like chemotaxis protein/DNA-binding transcriptional ArsR family regulator